MRLILFILLPLLGFSQAARQDSLEKLIRSSKPDTSKVKLMAQLGIDLVNSDPEKSGYWANEVLKLSNTLSYENGKALAYNMLGHYTMIKQDLKLATEYYKKALSINTRKQSKYWMAVNLSNLGRIAELSGDFSTGMNYYIQSLKIFETLKDSVQIAKVCSFLGELYRQNNNLPLALHYNKLAFKIQTQQEKKADLAITCRNLAIVYDMSGNMGESIKYFEKALNLYKQLNDGRMTALCLINIGTLYDWNNGDYKTALKYYEDGLTLSKAYNYSGGISTAYSNIGHAYAMMGQYNKALDYQLKSLSVARSIGYKFDCQNILAEISDTYMKKGDYKKALEFYQKFTDLKDSLMNEKSKSTLVELQTKYDVEKRELQLASLKQGAILLTQKNQIQSLSLTRKNYLIAGVILLSLLLVLLGYLLIKQKNLKAKRQKELLEQQLVSSNLKTLRAQMNPHFIYNSLNSIQGLVNVGENKKASSFIAVFSKLSRSILNYTEVQSVSLSEEIKFLRNYISIESLRFDNNFDYTIEIDEAINPEDSYLPPLIIQPLVENAIIHGLFHKEGQKELRILVSMQGNFLKWQIIDNGIGITESRNIQTRKPGHKSMGTNIIMERLKLLTHLESLENIITFTDRMGSERVSGTIVTILIPSQ